MVEVDPRMRVAELPASSTGGAAEEVELEPIDFDGMDTVDLFHSLEKTVLGYDDYENCFEKHFNRTLEGLQKLTVKIQKQSLFSENEGIEEVQTEHVKMLMLPYYEAEVLFRVMTDRAVQVRKAHTYFLEYLKLMNHYGLLEKPLQVKAWKEVHKKHMERVNPNKAAEDDEEEKDPSKTKGLNDHPMMALARQMEDRDTKIANFKLQK